LISWISIAGVLLGVTALIVVTSVINGFEAELVRSITSLNSHVFVFSRAQAVGGPDQIEARIREISPAVRAVSRSFISELMVGGPHGVSGAVVEGFDAATYGLVTRVPDSVKSGRLPQSGDEVAIGESLAQKIGAEVGGKIRMIAPFSGENGDSDAPKSREATVTGIIKVGMHQFDSKFLFAPLPSVQDFFEQPGRVTSFKIKLAEGADARETARRLADTLGFPFRAKDWSQMNSSLFYAIELEKVVISILLTAIILVAAFNMVSTLMMLIHDKIREISILKAMGLARRAQFSSSASSGWGSESWGWFSGPCWGLD
jgi:lipoprotein-releasing system permease protein